MLSIPKKTSGRCCCATLSLQEHIASGNMLLSQGSSKPCTYWLKFLQHNAQVWVQRARSQCSIPGYIRLFLQPVQNYLLSTAVVSFRVCCTKSLSMLLYNWGNTGFQTSTSPQIISNQAIETHSEPRRGKYFSVFHYLDFWSHTVSWIIVFSSEHCQYFFQDCCGACCIKGVRRKKRF